VSADEPGRCELPPVARWGAGGLLVACVLVLAAVYAAIGIGAFSAGGVATGAFTLENFVRGFGITASGGEIALTGSAWDSLIASLSCAFLVAPVGGAIGMAMVWILQRGGLACSPLVERISSYVLSVPSVVIGAGFLLAFGHLGLSTRGAWALILLAMLIRNLAVCMRFGGVALRRVDSSLGEISGLFGAGWLTTFSRVIAPMLHSTFVVCVAYGFVRSMTMLGSVLLLSSAENQVATTYMIDRVGIGEYGVSMAYGVVLAACIGGVLGLIWMFSSVRKNAPELHKAIGDLKAAVIHA
jgi:iron(III) transport system permease protein